MSFLLKYAPKTLSEVAGNPSAIEEIRKWSLEWGRGKLQKPLLIWGPTGIGKTAIVRAVAEEFDFELVEFGGDEERNKERMERVLGAAGSSGSIFGKKRLVLVDDVDSFSKEDAGFVGVLGKFISDARQPVILTAIDLYERKIAPMRNSCIPVQLKRINSSTVEKVLRRMNEGEGLGVGVEEIGGIARNADGDLRGAINDLMAANPKSGGRNRKKGIFETVRRILRGKSYEEGRRAVFEADEERDTLKLWVEENIPLEFESAEGRAGAFSALSLADVFDGRVRKRQYWGFLRYSSDLIGAGVCLYAHEENHGFVNYAFPAYLRKMSASKGGRAMRKKAGLKVGGKLHCSWRDAEVFFPLLKMQMKEEMDGVCALYCFDEEEIVFLSGKSRVEAEKERRKKEGGDGKKENGKESWEEGKNRNEKKNGEKSASEENVWKKTPAKRGRKKKDESGAGMKEEEIGGREEKVGGKGMGGASSGKEAGASKKNGSLADFV